MRVALVLGLTLTTSWLVACSVEQPPRPANGCSFLQVTDFVLSSDDPEPMSFPWCMRREMPFDSEGHVPCVVVLGRTTSPSDCSCEGALEPLADERGAALQKTWGETVPSESFNCLCEATQLSGEPLDACQFDPARPVMVGAEEVSGWCFVDPGAQPPAGNPALTASCPEYSKHSVRLLGGAIPTQGAVAMVVCETIESCDEP